MQGIIKLVEIYLLVVGREELITNFNSYLRTYTLEFIALLKLTAICLKNHMTSRKLLSMLTWKHLRTKMSNFSLIVF